MKIKVTLCKEEYEVQGVELSGTVLVNLTSTDKLLSTDDGIITIPASGIVATLRKTSVGMRVSNLPCTVSKAVLKAINVPDAQAGVVYLVNENIAREIHRLDVYFLSGMHLDENKKSIYTELVYYWFIGGI